MFRKTPSLASRKTGTQLFGSWLLAKKLLPTKVPLMMPRWHVVGIIVHSMSEIHTVKHSSSQQTFANTIQALRRSCMPDGLRALPPNYSSVMVFGCITTKRYIKSLVAVLRHGIKIRCIGRLTPQRQSQCGCPLLTCQAISVV